MITRSRIAALAVPLVLVACASQQPAVETVMADSLREGQRDACRARVADEIGQTSADVALSFSSVSPAGLAVYNATTTAGNYRCEVDNAFRVVSVSPLDI